MKRLVMLFQTDQGKTLRLSVPYPKDGLTDVMVSSAMNAIVDSGVLLGSTGTPTTVLSAYIEETTRTDLF